MSNPDPGPGGAALLAIGELAALAGKRPSAIRYYEQIGLLPPPARVAGQRRYHHHTVRTLAVIDTGQRAGLALDEIKLLLSASPDAVRRSTGCGTWPTAAPADHRPDRTQPARSPLARMRRTLRMPQP